MTGTTGMKGMKEIKTFNASEFNHSAQQVFRAADIDGEVRINHNRYSDIIFVLTTRPRVKPNLHDFMAEGKKNKK